MKALVTGASGFVGRHLIGRLVREGWTVTCMSRRRAADADGFATWIAGDLRRPTALLRALAQAGPFEVIFHLAAAVPTADRHLSRERLLRVNGLGTATLATLFERSGARVLVYASTLSVIGAPEEVPVTEAHRLAPRHAYAVSKLAGELVCEQVRRETGRRTVTLRIASAYGPGMDTSTVLPRFVAAALEHRDLPLLGTGARTQNFVHVRDVVAACMDAAVSDAAGVFNVAGPAAVSMRELAHAVLRAVPGCGSRVLVTGAPDPQEDHRWEVDLAAARRAFGYVPRVGLADGLAAVVDALRDTLVTPA